MLVPTRHGKTHYVLVGSGPLVVFSVGLFSDVSVVGELFEQMGGFTRLVYDYYDRGRSVTTTPVVNGKPTVRFDVAAYVTQLRELLEAIGLADRPFVHVGHSTGAGVGVGYSNRYPESVCGLCSISGVILPIRYGDWVGKIGAYLQRVPIFNDLVAEAAGRRSLLEFARKSCKDPAHPSQASHLRAFKARLDSDERFFGSLIATLRHFAGFVGSHRRGFEAVAQRRTPLLIVIAENDVTVTPADSLRLVGIAKRAGAPIDTLWLHDTPHESFTPDTGNGPRVGAAIRAFAQRCHAQKKRILLQK